ncbi:hypothetical protein WJX82_004061 [Trebouxia sp. C0006]
MDCWARPYAAPGFLSDRRLFTPVGDPFWDGYDKVAFQNADCTWLAGNFRDTGSDAVMILFPAFTIHKEMWPNPQLQLQLAVGHNISSLSVDIAGRGESCGHEIGPGCSSTIRDMAAAARFINSLPGRYSAGLFGLSSAGKAALFYAAQVSNIPAVFMAEPDDLVSLSEFVDHMAGGNTIQRLSKIPEFEVTMPNQADRLMMTAESYQENMAVNLTELGPQIPAETHMYWYTAETGSSLTSEMQNVSFAHLEEFHHRHFPDTRHDFVTGHPQDFLKIVALDMATEASRSAFALNFTDRHHHTVWEKAPACADEPEHASRRKLRRKKESRTMPKHFYIDDQHRSDFDRGLVNPAAVHLPSYGWVVVVMSYQGCFGSDCALQMERAFTPPLMAHMGTGEQPDPHNISHPAMTSFHPQSWATTVERLEAHPLGGLRFTSFRPFLFRGNLHLSYAIEIFDRSLPLTRESKSDTHKMRFQGTGFARVDSESREMQSLVAFSQPLVPRREFPCCDKNWGVMEHGKDLYIFYTLLPCLTIFRLDSRSETGATLVYASCLKDYAAEQISDATGLEMRDVRISGHPILWAQYPQTLLVLVHHNWRKHGGSKHWAVQLQFDPARRVYTIAAVSKEPVLNHEDFYLHNEAVQNVIAVGSYHLAGRRLRILYGDGDKYSAFADVHTSKISWHHLNSTSALEWTEGPTVALGDRIESISYTEYESLVW